MVYANDQWVQLPTRDLYDSQIMAMAINAAKDMYEKGQQEMKDFTKLYGDFYSLVPGRTQEVYDETLGKVRNVVDAIYAAGGDPLRSPEARALISRTINSVNAGKINAYRQEAELAKEYSRNRERAKMEGWYNEDLERYANKGKTLEEWAPGDGMWTSGAPIRFQTMDDIISPLAKSMTPEFDAIRTAQENNGYDYKTVSEDRIRQMVNDNIDDLINKSTIGKYYYDQALKASGKNPELAKQLLADQYAQIASKYTKEDREINQYTYAAKQDALRRQAAKEQAALEFEYTRKQQDLIYDLDGNGLVDTPEEKEYRRRRKEAEIQKMLNTQRDRYPNPFREADDKPGEYVEYDKKYGYENKISPANAKVVRVGETYDEEVKKYVDHPNWYRINAGDMKDLVNGKYIISENPNKKFKAGEFEGDVQFEADGYIVKKPVYSKDKDGKIVKTYAYYMSGDLRQIDGKAALIPKNARTSRALILINERDANYGEQQKKDKSTDTGK